LESLAGRIQIAALDPDGMSRPVAITHGPAFANVTGPAVSPDGRWLALVGTEKGRGAGNIYVEPFQRPGPRYQVTVDGGIQPLWRRDGREIFYRNGDGMYAVPVEAGREFTSGKPLLLFRAPHRRGSPNSPDYDVSPDGSRFLMVRMGEDESAPRRLNVVLNWVDEITRRVPTGRR
jgi:Tol biopolymer transport system component